MGDFCRYTAESSNLEASENEQQQKGDEQKQQPQEGDEQKQQPQKGDEQKQEKKKNTTNYAENAKEYYKEAQDFAVNLDYKNPVKLGIFLSYAIYFYEIEKNPEGAIKIIENTLKKAKEALKGIKEDKEETKESFQIVKLLEENLNNFKYLPATEPEPDPFADEK